MWGTINVVLIVDVITALSNGSLKGSLHMIDDSPVPGTHQGTPQLTTYCWPGWQILWTVRQVDLQTPAVIRSIRFTSSGSEAWSAAGDATGAMVWSGIVPAGLLPGHHYHYEVALQMGRGKNSVLSIDTPALVVSPA